MNRWRSLLLELRMRMENLGQHLTRRVQNAVIWIMLLMIYVFGLGLSRLMASLFFRKHLQAFEQHEVEGSFWQPVVGYDADPKRLMKQV